MPSPRASHVLCFLALLPLLPAEAASDLPRRKSGLWEISTRMPDLPAGAPAAMPIQMCVDQASDNLLQERSRRPSHCPTLEVTQGSGKLVIHAVCQHDGTTVISDSTITGDLERQYRNEMRLRYDPPQRGVRDMRVTQEARWLGPCPGGQKPGDVVMPGLGASGNVQEMMNDPRIKELMKRAPAGR